MTVVEIKLNQEEANLILRALELLEESCDARSIPGHTLKSDEREALQKLWGRVFDSGLDAGFGKEDKEIAQVQQIDEFDVPSDEDDEELSYCAPV